VMIGSFFTIRSDTWWVHVSVGFVRGIPLAFLVLGVLTYLDVRRRLSGHCELEHRTRSSG
jgi:hypothetical protein